MTEAAPLSLSERALVRLRRLAVGNGLQPADIALLESKEQNFTLSGKIEISPLCEQEAATYAGGVRNRSIKALPSYAALQEAVAKHKRAFTENTDWVAPVTQEIESYESHGWGLENAKVVLPQKSASYAATEACPTCGGRQMLTCTQCSGQGTVVCTQCHGQGREQCYMCSGRGENPHQPGQPCPNCHGTRLMPCRFCQTRGNLPCPTCQGRRGTPCAACQGKGSITQEIAVTCGAETFFSFKTDGLPSGLRRGMDRIGIANLGKGHAAITAAPPPKESNETPKKTTRILALTYTAVLPFAELRMGLGRRKAIVSVVGNRCALVDVPAFLDEPLQPWRDKLRLAATGKAALEPALEARAIKDVLALTLAGKGSVKELRKLYPFGLSPDAMTSLLTDTGRALNKTTLKTRGILAVLCVIASAGLFYSLYITGFLAWVTLGWNRIASFASDMAVLGMTLGAAWAILNFATLFALRRRFPQLSFALKQKIGKTGVAMLVGIALTFIGALWLSPLKPVWLVGLLR